MDLLVNANHYRKTLFILYLLAGILSGCGDSAASGGEKTSPRPNIVLIYCDDLGYGDLGVYGSEVHRTPHLDRMAEEGVKFTDFYVTSGVCTPSRSSLLTGSYPRRVDLHVNARPAGSVGRQVLFPRAHKGLNPDEITIAELLKEQGYATACIGKWHLGDQDAFLPSRQGFDYYYGIPYSNDMNRDFCPLPLMRNEEVIEAPVDQNTITKRYTEEVLQFITEHREEPFFVYFPHAMPHNPAHASEAFSGKSANGGYGDAVEEIDWSTGQILNYLRENGLAGNTLVIFTSDNGAASRWGGSNQPLSGWKGSTMEGGMRVPALFWQPGTLAAGQACTEMATTLDMLPTLAKLAGGQAPRDRILDGHDIWPLLTNTKAQSPYKYFYYYQLEQLQAVRSGPWKLHLPLDSMYENFHRATWKEGRPLKLVNLREDIKEENDLSEQHPEIVEKLLQYAEQARTDLGDVGREGANVRPAAIVEEPKAQLLRRSDF